MDSLVDKYGKINSIAFYQMAQTVEAVGLCRFPNLFQLSGIKPYLNFLTAFSANSSPEMGKLTLKSAH